MIFEWTDEKIEFFEQASKYTGFHKKLAALIRPYINGDDELIDVGCGLGLIDFEIAADVKSITAIDEHPAVVARMKERVKTRGATNIFPKVADAGMVTSGAWDTVLLSFFGAPDDSLKAVIRGARNRVIVLMHAADADLSHSLVAAKQKRPCVADMERFFQAEGCVCHSRAAALDFGQPLKSKEEALRFFECYSSGQDAETRRTRADFLMGRLVETGDAVYPYFLPKPKQVAIFIIER
jgi:ubiquinone/menaquinone biosynthesis C-methylase UbiE